MPTVTIEIFDETVRNTDHPEAVRLRLVLQDIAIEYGTQVDRFEVKNGVVTFRVGSKEMCAAIVRQLQSAMQSVPELLLDEPEFERRTERIRKKRRRE